MTHENKTTAYINYFPIEFCKLKSAPELEKDGLLEFEPVYSNTTLGFNVNCTDAYYNGSHIPFTANLSNKCNITDPGHGYLKSVARCSGEPYNASYF